MLQFDVIVDENIVTVVDLKKGLKMYDVSANVDGEIWRYRIKKKKGTKLHRKWRERGYQQAYYHANNSGSYVEFMPTHHAQPARKSKHHPDKLRLF